MYRLPTYNPKGFVVLEVDSKNLPQSDHLLSHLLKKARTQAQKERNKSRALSIPPSAKKQSSAVTLAFSSRCFSSIEFEEVFDPKKLSVKVDITDVIGSVEPIETFQIFFNQKPLELKESDGVDSWNNYLVSATGKIVEIEMLEEEL